MTPNKNRESGFYFAKAYGDPLEIAYYDSDMKQWQFTGDEDYYYDNEIDEVIGERIKLPNE